MPQLASITSLAIFLIAIMPHEGTSQSTRTGENTAAMSASRASTPSSSGPSSPSRSCPAPRPTPVAFHPTNDILFFSWNDSSYAQTSEYAVTLGNREVRPRNDEEALVRQSAISPDNRLRVWRDDKDLKLAAIDGANERVLTSLGDYRGNPVWSENSHQVAIISAGNIVSVNLVTGETRKITDYSDGEELNIRTWVGDSTVVYTLADRSEHRTIYFPTYTDHFVTPGASQRGVIHLTLRAVNIHSRENRSLAAGRISLPRHHAEVRRDVTSSPTSPMNS